MIKIESILISVYEKSELDDIIKLIKITKLNVLATKSTFDFLKSKGVRAIDVSVLNEFSAILKGKVKTLHPNVFGGIVADRTKNDNMDLIKYNILPIDCVVVDLYPFEKTKKYANEEQEILEKIDIGGVSLIRAAAKNYKNIVTIPSKKQYHVLKHILEQGAICSTNLSRKLAETAFTISVNYDNGILDYYHKLNSTIV